MMAAVYTSASPRTAAESGRSATARKGSTTSDSGRSIVVTLKEAREQARQARLLLLDGKDPIAERRAQRAAQRLAEAKSITFRKAAEIYINSHHRRLEERAEQAAVAGHVRDLCLSGDR